MERKYVLPIRVREDSGVIPIKGHSKFLKARIVAIVVGNRYSGNLLSSFA